MPEGPAKAKALATHAKVEAASRALDDMLALEGGACQRLVEAIIVKYIALSPFELAEWENDPEGAVYNGQGVLKPPCLGSIATPCPPYAPPSPTAAGYMRSMDVETSPDADTPRPCGVALLVCMLDRSRDAVAQTILALAAQIQSAASTPENVLLREACYRAIGECFTHLSQQVGLVAPWCNVCSISPNHRHAKHLVNRSTLRPGTKASCSPCWPPPWTCCL